MTKKWMRIIHRYLGFFLIGVMIVYSLSGVILIFRNTDFLKSETKVEKTIKPNLRGEALGRALKIKRFRVEKTKGDLVLFKNGQYNKATGLAQYTNKELPYVLNRMTHLHKATSAEPLFWLNVFSGVSLFFFAISSFWMFMPKTKIFKKGMYFTAFGVVLTLIMLFI
ncbi:hypothetical protein [Algibacter lectus]|uniref:Iron-regulated membrane protein n=2 Tax=Algibacter lectus TaxID=221126 RepID=A0A4R8MI07_9FLAO|nr:hypothetical protein [Algibacter lectus]MWW23701.1 hypothetical protein [Algibacter lectus]TDY63616.1 hypothetical protein DFQ06_0505 [Algibacter lectus]SFC38074.1 hypothetical protein SAMN04489722_102321 [Algibacter lectus]